MEINKIRKELNLLLQNIVEHSNSFSENRPIPSLEISAVLSKVNKMQEKLTVLKFLLEKQEHELKASGYSHKKIDLPLSKPAKNEDELVETNFIDEKITIDEEIVITTLKEEKTSLPPKKEHQEIAQKLKNTPIKNLKDAFSLNDKYLFANELFDKNMEAFNNLIKILDESNSINEAQEKLISAKTQYNWDEENNFYIEFTVLVERRFSI